MDQRNRKQQERTGGADAGSTTAYVNPGRCDQSPACPARRMCPQQAITQEGGKGMFAMFGGGLSKVDPDKCTGCGICLNYCPGRAIEMVAR